jgi:RNA polymerase sigma factor (sigma-70 family)
MHDGASVPALVAGAGAGDQDAWNQLVERYAPLVWSICQRYRLERPDIEEVSQNVWLHLVEKISTLREPAALPGWLATTSQRECIRVLRTVRRRDLAELPLDEQAPSDPDDVLVEDLVLAAERDAALRAAFAGLSADCRKLLTMLTDDPPSSYAEVSATLGIAVGSVGPTRARCLGRLRESPQMRAIRYGSDDAAVMQTKGDHGA